MSELSIRVTCSTQLLEVRGKYLWRGGEKYFVRMVTYGPFPDARCGEFGMLPPQDEVCRDLDAMVVAGFNAVRLYETPPHWFVDACGDRGLTVWFGPAWGWHLEFLTDRCDRRQLLSEAMDRIAHAVRLYSGNPTVGGIFVANEVPVDLVRWMGWRETRAALEDLIALGKRIDPERVMIYANYPPTEWIAPRNADVAAMNIYLHDRSDFDRYLQHAHMLAGDKPLLVSEVGIDVPREGEGMQSEVLQWAMRSGAARGVCGVCWFTWSADWRAPDGTRNEDWDFGLVTGDGNHRPALVDAGQWLADVDGAPEVGKSSESVAVVVCSRNGGERIGRCLDALLASRRAAEEILVVDDGSTDDTASVVGCYVVRGVRLVTIPPSGLSVARNRGAAETQAKWIAYTDDDCQPDEDWIGSLVAHVSEHRCGAVGGPNIPPPRENGASSVEWILDHAVGTANAVMIDDLRAEHLPGCNLMISRDAFDAVGGFRDHYVTAGDDVDICWRLIAAGYDLHYQPSAMVWHERRPSLRAYARQQSGYGRAEAMLAGDWPERVGRAGARWAGVVYGGDGLAFDPSGVYGGVFALPGFPLVRGGSSAWDGVADVRVEDALPPGWQWIARCVFRLQPWARAFGRWRGGQEFHSPRPVRRHTCDDVGSSEIWVTMPVSPDVGERVALIRLLADFASRSSWCVRLDDGGQDWDISITMGATRDAVVNVITVTEMDGASGLHQVGVRVSSSHAEAMDQAEALIRRVLQA